MPQIVWIAWFGIALIMLIRKITLYQSFTKYVRAGNKEVTDIEYLEMFGKIIDEQKVKVGVELCTNNLISSPLIIGIWKPCIVLPSIQMATTDFQLTILHELTHYKRKDIYYKWLTQIVICFHWFNPFVYLMAKQINRECELSCDEQVISSFSAIQKRAYGNTLLNAVKAGGTYKNSVASVTLWESKKLLSERLKAIMNSNRQSKRTAHLSIILLTLFIIGAIILGAYSAQEVKNIQNFDEQTTKTEKTKMLTQLEMPNVDIVIDNNAAVKFVSTTESEISVDFTDTFYDVDISNENEKWNIHISYIGTVSEYPAAIIYIPAISYGNINIQSQYGTVYFNSVFEKCNSINLDMELSTIFYTIPTSFTGKVIATMPDCYLELSSNNNYKNCDISILNCTSFGDVLEIFEMKGNNVSYSNGTKTGFIKIEFQDSGYTIIK